MSMQRMLVDFDRPRLQALLDLAAQHELDHISIGDHVSFRDGRGFDGMIHATAALMAQPSMDVHLNLYLLALRHPLPVARQVADIARLAGDRFVLGVGIGGEDRREVENCGVDPTTRGRRTDESLGILRRLLAGEVLDSAGEFFELRQASIRPTPQHVVPVLIGGRSDAALRRTAVHGDGWLALWVSPRRFREALGQIDDLAQAASREKPQWRHGIDIWAGFAARKEEARAHVSAAMEDLYGQPFDTFERWVPYGDADEVADVALGYVEAGARKVTFSACAQSPESAIAYVGEVRRRMRDATKPRSTETPQGERHEGR